MTPMTIAEFVKQGSQDGRSIKLYYNDLESPFIVSYWKAGFTSHVTLTDLPEKISDLPKASAQRAWDAYLTLRNDWYTYLLALRSRQDEALTYRLQRKYEDTRELLGRCMAPKEFYAAVAAVWRDQAEIDAGIDKRIADAAQYNKAIAFSDAA